MGKVHTHYDILQVSRVATEEVIRSAYRALSQKYHPDKSKASPDLAHERMLTINRAYDVLSDPGRRKQHDAWIDFQEAEIAKADAASKFEETAQYSARNNNYASAQGGAKDQPSEGRESGSKNTGAAKPDSRGAGIAKNQVGSREGQRKSIDLVDIATLCIGGGFFLAYLDSPLDKSGQKLNFFALIFEAFFLGRAAFLIFLFIVVAGIGYALFYLVRPWRRRAPEASAVFVMLAGIALLSGSSIQTGQHSSAVAQTLPVPIISTAKQSMVSPDAAKDANYSNAVAQLEKEYPELNPDLPGYRKDIVREIDRIGSTYMNAGATRVEALNHAISDLKKIGISQQKQDTRVSNSVQSDGKGNCIYSKGNSYSNGNCPGDKPSSSVAATGRRDNSHLSSGEQLTMDMACNEYEIKGDISGYQDCVKRQQLAADSDQALPSLNQFSSGESIAIGMACGEYQINGDISGYRSCMRAQIAKASR